MGSMHNMYLWMGACRYICTFTYTYLGLPFAQLSLQILSANKMSRHLDVARFSPGT